MTKARARRAFRVTAGQGQADFVRRLHLLKLDRTHRHHGRDRVLVDQLRLPVAAQKNAEIVEPGDVALKLDAIDEKDRHRAICSCGRR